MSPLRPIAIALMGAAVASAATDPIALNPAWSEHPTSPQQARVEQAPDVAKQFPMGVLPKLTSAVRPGWSFAARSTDRQWRPGGCEGLTNAVVAGHVEVHADNPADIAKARGQRRRPAGRDQVVAVDTDTGAFSWLLPVPKLAPAAPEEAPPMVPFDTQITGSRYLIVGAGGKPIRRINPLRLSSEATTSSESRGPIRMPRCFRTCADSTGVLASRSDTTIGTGG